MPGRWASTGAHVAGIWVGRPDGTPLIRRRRPGPTALPLLARVFERLPPAPRDAAAQRARPTRRAGAEALDRLRLTFPPPGAVLRGRAALSPCAPPAAGAP